MSRKTTTITDRMAAEKAQAKHLRAMLAADGITVSHSQALERVAALHGARDWNTLCAQRGATTPLPDAFGQELGVFEIRDWQDADTIAPGAPAAISFGISIDADGINIGAVGGEDFRGVKVEIQDGAIRVMTYDERVGESPAILVISADGTKPIRADLHDHFASANFTRISTVDTAPGLP